MANFRAKAKTGPPSPLVRPRPSENSNFIPFSAEGEGFSVYVHREVLDFIERESRQAAPDETIGLLAGRVCQDPVRGPYTLVLAADNARAGEVEASPGHVHISASGNASVRRRLEETHPDREVVGWYHSHPRYPARFSHVDTAEQSTWNDPNHVGIVFSGTEKGEPFGVYRGPEAVRLSRGHAPQPVEDPDFRVERHASGQTSAGQTRPDGLRSRVITIPPGGVAPAARPARPGAPIRAPRLFFALILLLLFVAVVWLHARVSSLETSLSGEAAAAIKPEPTAAAPTPTPLPAAVPGAEAEAKQDAPPVKQTGDRLPALMGAPNVTPPANPLNGGKRGRMRGRNKAQKK
ncbi:MAG TPA: Mov34/MPN/PAD-1 family protein [Pyrinomonadaceae bacterium]|jgi:proteasome lid subunit RPN8/RPN11